MNNYRCIYFRKVGNKFIQNSNSACWARIVDSHSYNFTDNETEEIPNYIYIELKQKPLILIKNIRQLVKLINIITPCSYKIINKKRYIRYKFTHNKEYYPNLLLLNFIRMTRYIQTSLFDIDKFFNDLYLYSNKKDALLFLTTSLRNNVKISTKRWTFYGDHSIVYKNIKPKTIEQFRTTIFTDVRSFLTK